MSLNVKILLPIPRQGVFQYKINLLRSFHDEFARQLTENEININDYALVDAFGRPYSYSEPLQYQNVYPGMLLELREIPSISEETDLVKPILDMNEQILITFELADIDMPSFEVLAKPGMLVSKILHNKYPDIDLSNCILIFQEKQFSVNQELASIGAANGSQVKVVRLLPDDQVQSERNEKQDEIQDSSKEEADGEWANEPQEKDSSQVLSEQQYEIFQKEKEEWDIEHGNGQLLPPEVRRELYLERAELKEFQRFKLVQSEFSLSSIEIIKMKPLQKVSDLYKYVMVSMSKKMIAKETPSEQIEEFCQEFKLCRINSGIIENSEIELFEAFLEGDATIDLLYEKADIRALI